MKTIELPPSDQELLQECEIKTARCPRSCEKSSMPSAIRLKHIPTGIVIRSFQEKDRYLNQIICLKKLRMKVASMTTEVLEIVTPRAPRVKPKVKTRAKTRRKSKV